MRKLMFLIVLSIIGAGQMKADPACTPNTAAFYEANITSHASACSIGGLDFWLFNGANAGTLPSGPGSSPFTPAQIEITPVSGSSGVGLMITPLTANGFQATATGVRDLELPFQVACDNGTNCLTSIFMSISGSAPASGMSGGTDGKIMLTESYCIGGVAPPPTAPCPPGTGGTVKQDILPIGPSSPGTVSKTDTFSAVSEISVNKDIQAVGNNGSAIVTSVTDFFSAAPVTTPQPSTVLLLGGALAGLGLLSMRRRQSLG
jgi:hypothetical protein